MSQLYKDYTLYKRHENKDCQKLLDVVRYLYYKGFDFRPRTIIERWNNAPLYHNNTEYNQEYTIIPPTINITHEGDACWLYGLNSIVELFERLSGIMYLLEKSENFMKLNPRFRIVDGYKSIDKAI